MEEVLQQQDKRIAEQRQKDVEKSNKNLEELKSRVNQTGRMSASRDRKKKKEEWDRKI